MLITKIMKILKLVKKSEKASVMMRKKDENSVSVQVSQSIESSVRSAESQDDLID